MDRSYVFGDIVVVRSWIDEDGNRQTIYVLPSPKSWQFVSIMPGEMSISRSAHSVRMIRVCITVAPPLNTPLTIVVPFGEDGKEHLLSALHLPGITNLIGVLDYLGFTPTLPSN